MNCKHSKLENATVSDKINDQVAKIGEKIQLTRFERIDAEAVASYIHGAYRMGVLVGLNKTVRQPWKPEEKLRCRLLP